MLNTLNKPISHLPIISAYPHEKVIRHGNKLAIVTLNDTTAAREAKANSPKFSVYIGNGKEPYRDPVNPNVRVKFDLQDDDHQSIAAQFHVTSLTDISTYNLVPRPGQVLRNRSAIKGKADVVEFNSNEMVIINSGASSRNSNDFKTFVPGGVHIYAGDRHGMGSRASQPMVLGKNLQKAIDEIFGTLQSISSNITDINIELVSLKFQLITHVHASAVGPTSPSPTLAAALPPTMLAKDVKRVMNSYVDMINHWIERINRIMPISKTNVLSAFHTVN